MLNDTLSRARDWLAEDPDPRTRAELAALLDAGTDEAAADLADRFAGTLQFGTAGLRGELGAGPMRMNRAVVIRAAAGLAAYLVAERAHRRAGRHRLRRPPQVGRLRPRHRGRDDRRRAARRDAARGRCRRRCWPSRSATSAPSPGVMVTASHNPPQDNGYKVYLGDGSQIVPPADAEHRRARSPRSARWTACRARRTAGRCSATRCSTPTWTAPSRCWPPDGPRDLDVVYTPLHGVGRDTLTAAFARAGLPGPVVGRRRRPSPIRTSRPWRSPTRRSRARWTWPSRSPGSGADLVIANDPDADRCAVAVPDASADGGWRMLRGDEVGALLAAHLVGRGATRHASPRPSSPPPCSRRIAAAAGLPLRGDPHRLQVDRPGATACATATRRRSATASTRTACATRTASARRCWWPNWPRA